MDLKMVKQAMELKNKMDKVQKELGKMTVEAESGNGAVKVKANGQQKVLSITISPEVVNPAKVKDLEKLVLKAVEDALEKSRKLASDEMKQLTGGMNFPGLT